MVGVLVEWSERGDSGIGGYEVRVFGSVGFSAVVGSGRVGVFYCYVVFFWVLRVFVWCGLG